MDALKPVKLVHCIEQVAALNWAKTGKNTFLSAKQLICDVQLV
jgi:hypothetical protein